MNVILEVKELEKKYKDTSDNILNKINLLVEEGEFIAIMGRSGSGKSTLLYTVSGMDDITKGSVKFDGVELTTQKEDEIGKIRLAHMGFVFQHSYLLKMLSVRENILLPAMKLKKENKKGIMKKVEDLMKRLEIDEVGDYDITHISGGQLQRAAIGRALMNDPRIIFADEPTGALNTLATMEVMNILSEINRQGTTILLVTHDSKVAARADRIIYLSDGMIQEELMLGKCSEKTVSEERIMKMDQWLKKQGF